MCNEKQMRASAQQPGSYVCTIPWDIVQVGIDFRSHAGLSGRLATDSSESCIKRYEPGVVSAGQHGLLLFRDPIEGGVTEVRGLLGNSPMYSQLKMLNTHCPLITAPGSSANKAARPAAAPCRYVDPLYLTYMYITPCTGCEYCPLYKGSYSYGWGWCWNKR